MSDITIVTAFFDIGRGNWTQSTNGLQMPHYIPRKTETYFKYFADLAKVKNDMVIYCGPEHAEQIDQIRKTNAPESNTKVFVVNFSDAIKTLKPLIEGIQKRQEYIDLIDDSRMPEYWNADYVIVNLMKTDFVVNAYKRGQINTDLTAWLDFGYVRSPATLPKNLIWKYNFDPSKMHYFNKQPIDFERPIFDIIKTNSVYIMGCHIIGGKDAWEKHKQLTGTSLQSLLHCGLIDDDQTFLLMNYKMDPNSFELHPINVKQEEWSEWNVAMINFNDGQI